MEYKYEDEAVSIDRETKNTGTVTRSLRLIADVLWQIHKDMEHALLEIKWERERKDSERV